MHPQRVEGVVKFRAVHEDAVLDEGEFAATVAALRGWRGLLRRIGGVGRDPDRYDGAAYGNLSVRLPPFGEDGRGRPRFLVTGTQTGDRPDLALADCCVVEACDLERNEVTSFGGTPPSSEALTHGAIYAAAPSARAVFHVHDPGLWHGAKRLGLPVTRAEVPYGTPEMAREVARLFGEGALRVPGIFAMGGHEDGVIACGDDADAAGVMLLRAWAASLASSEEGP